VKIKILMPLNICCHENMLLSRRNSSVNWVIAVGVNDVHVSKKIVCK
jgi:hypothetical protein